MILERRTATSSDTEFARTTHHAAFRDVVSRQFGTWDEALQDRLFEEEWIPDKFEIILCDNNPCGFLSIEDHPDHIYVRWIAITPPISRTRHWLSTPQRGDATRTGHEVSTPASSPQREPGHRALPQAWFQGMWRDRDAYPHGLGSLVGRLSRGRKPTRPRLSDYAALIRPTDYCAKASNAARTLRSRSPSMAIG